MIGGALRSAACLPQAPARAAGVRANDWQRGARQRRQPEPCRPPRKRRASASVGVCMFLALRACCVVAPSGASPAGARTELDAARANSHTQRERQRHTSRLATRTTTGPIGHMRAAASASTSRAVASARRLASLRAASAAAVAPATAAAATASPRRRLPRTARATPRRRLAPQMLQTPTSAAATAAPIGSTGGKSGAALRAAASSTAARGAVKSACSCAQAR